MKKLKITNEHKTKEINNLFIDSIDSDLSLEHSGHYLALKPSSKKTSPRLYLSRKHHEEYNRYKSDSSKVGYQRNVKLATTHILTHFPKHKEFIIDTLNSTLKDYATKITASKVVRGIYYTLSFSTNNKSSFNIKSINDMGYEFQKLSYDFYSSNENALKDMRYFYIKIQEFDPRFNLFRIVLNYNSKPIEALPSSTVYQ